ncbi:MAG: hypothetical protein IJE47_03105 [Bacteroidales bacterium]|nr:hypothetical protein [Bacteroidales bacterium]
MKKTSILSKSLIVMILLFVASTSQMFAQISEGEPYSRTIRTGNRPGYGDWGIFIGPSLSEIGQMIDSDITWRGLPLVNVKYYMEDNLELRLGLQLSKSMEKIKGDLIVDERGSIYSRYVDGNSYYRLTPGIAYHFSSTNLLDVYVGANLPFGLSSEQYVNETGDMLFSQKRSSFEIGIGAFIGLQCFVADLPVAIGVEYGFSGMKYLGQKYENIIVDEDGVEQVFYSTTQWSDDEYSTLKSSNGFFGSDIRLTISYFFK